MAELRIINMDEVVVEEVEWLWYPYIPFGNMTIVRGDGVRVKRLYYYN